MMKRAKAVVPANLNCNSNRTTRASAAGAPQNERLCRRGCRLFQTARRRKNVLTSNFGLRGSVVVGNTAGSSAEPVFVHIRANHGRTGLRAAYG